MEAKDELILETYVQISAIMGRHAWPWHIEETDVGLVLVAEDGRRVAKPISRPNSAQALLDLAELCYHDREAALSS